MELLPDERKNLHLALTDAFQTANALEDLTFLELSVALNVITAPAPLTAMVREVIKYFEQRTVSAT